MNKEAIRKLKKGDIILHDTCRGMEYHFIKQCLSGNIITDGRFEPLNIFEGKIVLKTDFEGYYLKN